MNTLPILFGTLLAGALLGYWLRMLIALSRKGSIELETKHRLVETKEAAQRIIDTANKKAEERLAELRTEEHTREEKLQNTETRLIKKEELLDTRAAELDREHETLKEREGTVLARESAVQNDEALLTERLEVIGKLTMSEARAALIARTEAEFAEDLELHRHKLETQMQEDIQLRAREILATAINRLAVSVASELTTATIQIPSEDIKGKIIGKEGRNIRAFERLAGVELIVDDAPGAIIVSSFDPVRRAVAAEALGELIKDGRIQPAKIEEVIQKAQENSNETMKKRGTEAVYECGIYNFDPRLVSVIGRLHFRTSYGQNVLQHSIECAHLAGMLAEELKADVQVAKAGALVHDIGKALDHEVQGSHVDIGIRILRRFNTDERIIAAMKSHHDDCPHETVEAVIVQVADMISGSRPGARRDTAENYIKRLQELEGLAVRFAGVERAFALQAGREIRIFVHPENVTDSEARTMARAIALEIESELRYPGEIKVTIIRETRIIDFAR
ncbi:MAG TPA: ribonuclease Y [Candidatus Paceibacterota bacterium]|nr:ribonuclease Y [Candidatus Paceibacterota bacterium]